MRAFLRLYPRELREQFGDEMVEFVRERRQRVAGRGIRARLRFWSLMAADVLVSAGRSLRHATRWSLRAALSGAWTDLRGAFRFFGKSAATTASIVGLLAITLAAATLVFSVVNAVLIRPLPFGAPSRLVVVWEARDGRTDRNVVGGHEFPEWIKRTHTFEHMTALAFSGPMTLTGVGEATSLQVVRVTAGFTETMGVQPEIGRAIRDDEEVPGRGQVVLISHRLWRDRFASSTNVLGTHISLEGQPFEIIGVMPASFKFPPPPADLTSATDLWLPLDQPIHLFRGRHFLYVVGRLRQDASVTAAQADMDRITRELRTEWPDLNRGHGALVVPLHDDLVRAARASLLLVLGAVGCLLLVGCGNVAGLLIARGLGRRREISVRLALGATPGRIVRQLLIESLTLAAAGGAVGVVLAATVARALPAIVPSDVVPLDRVPLDATVLLFAIVATAATGVVFGVVPSVQLGRVPVTEMLKRGGRAVRGDGGRSRRVLVVTQIGLTIVLVLAAGSLMRALAALHRVDPGYRATGVLAVDLSLSNAGYPTPLRQRQFFDELTAQLRTLPTVEAVSTVNAVPLGGSISGIAIGIEGRPAAAPGDDVSARYRVVGAGYFRTLQIPLRAGREFAASDARVAIPMIRWYPQQPMPAGSDRPQSPPVAVINQAMASAFWPGESPIGRRFTALLSPAIEVVGVVADTYNDSLRQAPVPEFYLCDCQEPQRAMTLLIRTTGDPAALAPSVRDTVRGKDADVPIGTTRPLSQIMAATFGLPRFTSALVTSFAAIALLLMSAGIYGLMAFATTRRLPEIGVRLALGAPPETIRRAIVGDGLTLAAIGSVAGLLLAWMTGRWLQTDFLDVKSPDVWTIAGVTAVIAFAAVTACWLPARRAAATDPVSVLRQEH